MALVLQNYMLERFLERVSLSRYHDNYIIKGGFLIASMVGLDSRATMDMDATIKGYPVNEEALSAAIGRMMFVITISELMGCDGYCSTINAETVHVPSPHCR